MPDDVSAIDIHSLGAPPDARHQRSRQPEELGETRRRRLKKATPAGQTGAPGTAEWDSGDEARGPRATHRLENGCGRAGGSAIDRTILDHAQHGTARHLSLRPESPDRDEAALRPLRDRGGACRPHAAHLGILALLTTRRWYSPLRKYVIVPVRMALLGGRAEQGRNERRRHNRKTRFRPRIPHRASRCVPVRKRPKSLNTLDRDRTCNLQLRRLTLYPIELRGPIEIRERPTRDHTVSPDRIPGANPTPLTAPGRPTSWIIAESEHRPPSATGSRARGPSAPPRKARLRPTSAAAARPDDARGAPAAKGAARRSGRSPDRRRRSSSRPTARPASGGHARSSRRTA
jgi:hypothetical protein